MLSPQFSHLIFPSKLISSCIFLPSKLVLEGLKLAEQLKLDNTAVQKGRNWTLAQKRGWGVSEERELLFLLFLGIVPVLRESKVEDDLKLAVPLTLKFGVELRHYFKYSANV